MKTFLQIFTLLIGISIVFCAGPARAGGDPLLTVTVGDKVTEMDLSALEALPQSSFDTSTIWTEGPQHFEGVRMVDLLAQLGISEGTLQLTAANDYSITIPVADFRPDGAMLAYKRNGAPMSLRSKGPLWLVYPYDASPDFQTEVIYSNSIWQLDRIALVE